MGNGDHTMSARVLDAAGELPQGEEKRRAVTAMFDRVAPDYERMNHIISLGLDRRWRSRTVEALRLAPRSHVLDLACGTGDLARDLERDEHVVTGVDLSEGMLDAARTDAPLVRGDGVALPFAPRSFDAVVCGFALRNFVDLRAVLAEVARVLRRGGTFAALDAAVPAHPLLRAGNTVWFRGAVPLLGRFLARDAEAYRYLPRSTDYLPDPATLLALLDAAGLRAPRRTTMTGGSVQLLTGTRG
jgi:demethylmenaquinone methyltransferase/2-methoxy-6-polyprenyl-1,4-benzoquinol methylase